MLCATATARAVSYERERKFAGRRREPSLLQQLPWLVCRQRQRLANSFDWEDTPAVDDANGDGRPNVVTGNPIRINDGKGHFTAHPELIETSGVSERAPVKLVELNGGGYLALVAVNDRPLGPEPRILSRFGGVGSFCVPRARPVSREEMQRWSCNDGGDRYNASESALKREILIEKSVYTNRSII
jgi:hypothetical protein